VPGAADAKHLPRYLREWSYRFNRRNLPDGLDRYLIRRAVECASITYDQLTAGVMPADAARKGQSEFWVCDDLPQWSSFHRDLASRHGAKHHRIVVDCVPIKL
jgi:hypothetical protein